MDLSIKIYDLFVELQSSLDQIKRINVNTSDELCHNKALKKKCVTYIIDAKGTFDSRENLDKIHDKFFVPFIANLYSLSLANNKERDKCIKLVNNIDKNIRNFIKTNKYNHKYNDHIINL